MTKPVCRTT